MDDSDKTEVGLTITTKIECCKVKIESKVIQWLAKKIDYLLHHKERDEIKMVGEQLEISYSEAKCLIAEWDFQQWDDSWRYENEIM